MILEALVRHYDQLADDPDNGVAPYGYSLQQVGFCIVLQPGGKLHAIEPLTDETSGKPRPIKLILPGQSKPSGSGINPCFLWDNPTYLLGHVPDGRDSDWATKRFDGFRDRHLGLRKIINDEGFDTVCDFLEKWEPAGLLDRNDAEPLTRPGFGVFRLRGEERFVHQRKAIDQYWCKELDPAGDALADSATAEGFCLATGQRGPIARLHEPKIKGVSGAQSSGATLVSFNLSAFNSAGKDQGLNASVGEQAAFQYATALNALLADNKHRVQLGDTTVVFWTEKSSSTQADAPGTPDPADALAEAFGVYKDDRKPKAEGEKQTRSTLRDFLERYRKGRQANNAQSLESADTPFYVLGLSPNAARISVRFWLNCTVAELAERLGNYVEQLAMTGSRTDESSPILRQLMWETAREAKDIPPQLAGDFARALLTGNKYPHSFAVAILRRIVADRSINHPRAAGLKAWLIRNHQQEVPVSLDPQRTEEAYLLGRLFAAYEKIQSDSTDGKLNRTIRDSYLSSASATPGVVFPRLYKLNQHHLSKLSRDKPGLAVVRERLIGEICQNLSRFPNRLSLEQQGLFAIGFYHQTQDFYTRRTEPQPTAPSEE